MITSFSKYAEAVNNICLVYNGPAPDYVVQLNYILPAIRAKFKDTNVSLSVRDDMMVLTDDAIPLSKLEECKDQFALVKHFKTDPGGLHPVLNFIREANLSFPASSVKKTGRLCLVCPDAIFPSMPLTSQQIDKAIRTISAHNCEPLIMASSHPHETKKVFVDDACWVMGAENEYVFLAGARCRKVTLISSGQGTELFKMLFPHGEVNERF